MGGKFRTSSCRLADPSLSVSANQRWQHSRLQSFAGQTVANRRAHRGRSVDTRHHASLSGTRRQYASRHAHLGRWFASRRWRRRRVLRWPPAEWISAGMDCRTTTGPGGLDIRIWVASHAYTISKRSQVDVRMYTSLEYGTNLGLKVSWTRVRRHRASHCSL